MDDSSVRMQQRRHYAPRVALYICSFTLCSCYSFSPLTEEDRADKRPADIESILVTLHNGCVIKAGAYHHVQTTEPSDFIYGIGTMRHRITGRERSFAGRLERAIVDSMRLISVGPERHITCYLGDSVVIQFRGRDHVLVNPEQDAGLWIAGLQRCDREETIVSRLITSDEIKAIEVKKFDAPATILSGMVAALVIVALAQLPGNIPQDFQF